jgi:hypothetical protein
MVPNLPAAWIGFLLGSLAGMVTGLFFHGEGWLGGYGSWERRMVRLGHIAFFGLGFLNLGFAFTVQALDLRAGIPLPSTLLIVGAATMPLVCYLSAWRKPLRSLFFIPALSVASGVVATLWRILAS